MDSNYDFQKFADFMNDWNIMEEFSDSVLKGLRFSVIFLEGEGAFCDWMVSFTSNKKMQLAEAEETRKASLRRIFGGYDIEYNPDDYFFEVDDEEFIENAVDEYNVAPTVEELIDTTFEALIDLAKSTAFDDDNAKDVEKRLLGKKAEAIEAVG